MIALLLALPAVPAATAPQAVPAATAPQAVPAATALPMPQALGRQAMPKQGCAAYLWSVTDPRLVAVASAEPATLRIALAGKPVDYARVSEAGTGGFGFAASTRYAAADVGFTLAMTVSTESELGDGALVQEGTLTIERAGGDALVVPVGGLIGCAAAR